MDPYAVPGPGSGRAPVPHLVATFVYDLPEDRWTWSPIGGSSGGGVCAERSGWPCCERPCADIADQLEDVVAAAMTGGPVVHRAAVTDSDGREREIVVLAESDVDEAGPLTGLRGFVFDLVPGSAAEDELTELRLEVEMLWQAVGDADVTGQAKGVLMASCGCSADVAADALQELVRRSGLKLREVAEWLIRSCCAGDGSLAEALNSLGLDRDR